MMRDAETFASHLLALEISFATLVDALDKSETISKAEITERIRLLAGALGETNNLDLTHKVGAEMVRIADSLRLGVKLRANEH